MSYMISPYSIRTRIKTAPTAYVEPTTVGQRPYSIRTRIKTYKVIPSPIIILYVRDHIPLEQGLRLDVLDSLDRLSNRSETIFH